MVPPSSSQAAAIPAPVLLPEEVGNCRARSCRQSPPGNIWQFLALGMQTGMAHSDCISSCTPGANGAVVLLLCWTCSLQAGERPHFQPPPPPKKSPVWLSHGQTTDGNASRPISISHSFWAVSTILGICSSQAQPNTSPGDFWQGKDVLSGVLVPQQVGWLVLGQIQTTAEKTNAQSCCFCP